MTSLDGDHLTVCTDEYGSQWLVLPTSWYPKFENYEQVKIMFQLLQGDPYVSKPTHYIHYTNIDGKQIYYGHGETPEEIGKVTTLQFYSLWIGSVRHIVISPCSQVLVSEFNTPELEEYLKKRIADVLPEYQRLIAKLV